MLAVHPVVLRKDLLDFERDAILCKRHCRLGAVYARSSIEQLQADEILPRIQHAVAVVDAHPGNHSLGKQSAQHAMRRRKDARILHAQANQVVDIEETAVVDLFARNSPVREAVYLEIEEK